MEVHQKRDKKMSEYCTAEKVCELFGISRATLWRWEHECDDFPQPLRIGKVIRYSLPGVLAFARARSGKRADLEQRFDAIERLTQPLS